MLFDLSGRTALVTGSSRGLGHGIAQGMAKAGARLIVNGVEPSRVERAVAQFREDGFAAGGAAFDVTDEAAIAAVDAAIQTHGGNGLALEYGLADLWFVTRLMRTAPVSREMVLNFVASHSLGLPLSY